MTDHGDHGELGPPGLFAERRKAIADEFRAVPVEGDREVPEWLDKALDVGVYPASGPGDRVRTPYEDGYNAAVIEITESVEKAWAGVSLTGSGLREAAEAVDKSWFVVEVDKGRDEVRLRYASDLPARLNDLRAALSGESGE